MEITKKQIIKLQDGSELHRYALDGKHGTGPSDQFVTTLSVFSSREFDKVVMVDQVFCGENFNDGDTGAGNATVIELNVYDQTNPVTGTAAGDMGDAQVPDYPQSVPVGFNQKGSAPEFEKWTQSPVQWAANGQALQVDVRTQLSADIPPVTVQFRYSLKKIQN